MDILTTILIAALFFILGAAIVGLIWYLKRIPPRASEKPKVAATEGSNLSEIARLMRNMDNQELVVEMNGQNFNFFHELSPAQQRRLSFTSNVLAKWIAEAPPEQLPEEEPATTPPQAAPETTEPVDGLSLEARAGYTPPFASESTEEVKPVATDLTDVVGGMLNTAPKPVPAFKSIAMQINEILQARLAGTDLESRGITLSDAPDHGVVVTLDGKQYSGVTEIPDEEVRNAIRAAVLEWETKK